VHSSLEIFQPKFRDERDIWLDFFGAVLKSAGFVPPFIRTLE
jgi:hypothetical protein